MSLQDIQTHIRTQVWQAIAQSELDVSSLDKATLQTLVDLVIEATLSEVDTEMEQEEKMLVEETAAAAPIDTAKLDDLKEDVLWEGRPFLSLSVHYTITDERIRITEGMLGKSRQNIELIRVQDLDYHQSFGERMLSIGNIEIRSHDPNQPKIVLENIKDVESIYEILRRAVLHARKRHGFTYREEM